MTSPATPPRCARVLSDGKVCGFFDYAPVHNNKSQSLFHAFVAPEEAAPTATTPPIAYWCMACPEVFYDADSSNAHHDATQHNQTYRAEQSYISRKLRLEMGSGAASPAQRDENFALTYQPAPREVYYCGCIRSSMWNRCESHTTLAHDEEPPPQLCQRRTRFPNPDVPSGWSEGVCGQLLPCESERHLASPAPTTPPKPQGTFITTSTDVRPFDECEVIEGYMPPFPHRDTRPICAIRHIPSGSFLRYSKGPKTGTFWDIYGDDFLNVDLALSELRKATRAALPAASPQEAPTPDVWRCFHCDEVFTDKAEAQKHFGDSEWAQAACIIQRETGLVASIRELEVRNHELLHRAQEAEYDAEGYSGLRAELKRYFGASDAWTCWNRMDEKQGEILALTERLAALRAEHDRTTQAAQAVISETEKWDALVSTMSIYADDPERAQEWSAAVESMREVMTNLRADLAASRLPESPT